MKRTTSTFRHSSFFFLFLFSLFAATNAVAQELPNGGFEAWSPSGKEPPFNWEEPTGWKSSNSYTEFISAGVRKAAGAHGGTLACSLSTLNVFGSDVPAAIATGNPKVDFSTYSIDLMSGGVPYAERPDELAGFYRFGSASSGDAGYAIVILKKYNPEKEGADTVGFGAGRLEAADAYTAFTIPITYKSDAAPDSVVVAFLSSDPSSLMSGGTLVVDDVVFRKDGSGVADGNGGRADVRLYPNPASNVLHLELEGKEAGNRTVIFYDLLGREVLRRGFGGTQAAVDLALPSGLYTCRVMRGEREEFAGKIVVNR